MRLKYFLAIVVTLLIMGAFFFKDHSESPLQTAEEPVEEIQKESGSGGSSAKLDQAMQKQADVKTLKDKSVTAETSEQALAIAADFADHVKLLGTCLGVQPAVSGGIEPTFENLSASLKPALGEVVVRMDDWAQQDFKTEDGSLRRIRTEVEYQETGNPIKRAQFYKINAQGMPELQTLNPDQATDPSDDFISSLKGDGQVTIEEKGGRIYYQEGEELVMVERGGKVQSFSITKGDKTFSCTETDATTSNCQCL